MNPKHLSWKTIAENLRDCRAHGTQVRNLRGNRGVLTEEQVEQIRLLKGRMTQAKIAKRYGVSPPTVRDIQSGRSRVGRKVRKALTDSEVNAIRSMKGMRLADIASQFKTTRTTVSRILRGVGYAYVPHADNGQQG